MKNWIRNIAVMLSLVATAATAQMNNPGAPGNVVAGNNMSQSGNIIGIAAPVTIANGGTGAITQSAALAAILGTSAIPVANGGTAVTSASGTALDNITGFSGTGFISRTGAGTYSFTPSSGSGNVALQNRPVNTVTTAYTAATTDYTIRANAASGNITVTLMASPPTGLILNIKKVDSSSNSVTVSGNGNVIDGAASQIIPVQYQAITIQFNGTSWDIL